LIVGRQIKDIIKRTGIVVNNYISRDSK
jgi:hypothetical protein